MVKYLQIKIEKPCQQRWDEMTPVPGGNFCASCQKTVVDLTAMSDAQLVAYLQRPDRSACAKFYEDQLDRNVPVPAKKIPWLKYFFQVSLPALLLGYKASAQALVSDVSTTIVGNDKLLSPIQGSLTVSGKITGFDGEPLAGASVLTTTPGKGIAADSNGIFRLVLEPHERTLEVSMVGYESETVTVTGPMLNLSLSLSAGNNLSVISVGTTTCVRTTMGSYSSISVHNLREVPVAKYREEAIRETIFPNPAKRDDMVTIQWSEPVVNDQYIVLFNAAGVKLKQELIYIHQPSFRAKLNIHVQVAGHYIIHSIDAKTHAKQVFPLIVQ